SRAGYEIIATGETARVLVENGLKVEQVSLKDNLEELMKQIARGEIALVINTPTKGKMQERAGFKIRRTAADYRVPCLTSLDTARAYLVAVEAVKEGVPECRPVQEYISI
ncbi:MAG: carbamoyl-phosphate synthase large subunit, partial [Desulfitobacteriaceae bacterium]|nr:carbamoyl-phosphate synthase large subunit [Desulfitobacteriaceae bacterium]